MTRLVVVGDSLLDVDLVGRAERLCPDAPVPVVDEVVEQPRPGGAALAALLAAREGHDVTLVTPLGSDEGAEQLRKLLAGSVRLEALTYDGPTPVKRRVRVDGHSIVRLDTGGTQGRVGGLTPAAKQALGEAEAVLVSDYGRGMTAVTELRRRIEVLSRGVPTVWDPHPRGAEPVPGVRLVTPNTGEARQFARRHGIGNTRSAGRGLASVTRWANGLVSAWRVGAVAVTMSERGALLSYGRGAPVVLPSPRISSGDACGAGDRFAATAAACLGAGSVTAEAVQAAVASATAFVAAGGAAQLTERSRRPGSPKVDELVHRVRAAGGVVVATGGCFDLLHAGHVATLRAARQLGDCLVVCLNSDVSVRHLKGPGRPLVTAADRARVLEALECVDGVVVFDEDTPVQVLQRVRPDIWAKGGDYAGSELPEAEVLDAWGGQAVVLPYVPGRSTTALVMELTRTAQGVGDSTWTSGR